MQKYYTGSLIHLHKCESYRAPSSFPAGCELYPAQEVDAELARLRERVVELQETVRWLISCGAIKIWDCGTFFNSNTAAGNIPTHLAPLIAEAVKP